MTNITNWINTVADIRLISEIRITIRSLGVVPMMTSAWQRVWLEKTARSIGGDSARDSQPPDRPPSQDRSGYGEGEADANNIFLSDVLASASQEG